jgi:hypothetical protein
MVDSLPGGYDETLSAGFKNNNSTNLVVRRTNRVDILLNYDEKLTPNPYDSSAFLNSFAFTTSTNLEQAKVHSSNQKTSLNILKNKATISLSNPSTSSTNRRVKLSTQPYDITHQEISCLIGFAYITKEDATKADLKWDTDEIKSLIELELELYEVWLNQSSFMYRKFDWSENANWKMIEENFNYQTTDFQGNGLFKAAGLL